MSLLKEVRLDISLLKGKDTERDMIKEYEAIWGKWKSDLNMLTLYSLFWTILWVICIIYNRLPYMSE